MRILTSMKNNIYTTKLYDVIIKQGIKSDGTKDEEVLFLVMDFVQSDVKKVL